MQRRAIICLVAACAMTACVRERADIPTTGRTRVTGADLGITSNDDAVGQIATARCDREVACNKIGDGRAYPDQASCLAQIGELVDEEAGTSACPFGVDSLSVSRCLLDIRRTECGGELEQATNIPSCTKAVLCSR